LGRIALGMAILVVLPTMLAACAIGSSDKSGHITVQHILIAVNSGGQSAPFRLKKQPARTPDEAKELATQILKKAMDGEDFDKLMNENSDDSPPGIYTISDYGVPAEPGEYPRSNVPLLFGNACFTLKVGEIGIAPFDPTNNPVGYQIIKRLK
jgi:hypothetical protein